MYKRQQNDEVDTLLSGDAKRDKDMRRHLFCQSMWFLYERGNFCEKNPDGTIWHGPWEDPDISSYLYDEIPADMFKYFADPASGFFEGDFSRTQWLEHQCSGAGVALVYASWNKAKLHCHYLRHEMYDSLEKNAWQGSRIHLARASRRIHRR